MLKKEKNEEKNWNCAIPDTGLLRKKAGKRWKNSEGIIAHQEAKHKIERRGEKFTEVNATLGKQLSRASPTPIQEAVQTMVTSTTHSMVREGTGHCWNMHVLEDIVSCKSKGSCCTHCQGFMKCKNRVIKKKKKKEGRNVLKLSSSPRYNYRI